MAPVILATGLTFGQSESSWLLQRQIEKALDHLNMLDPRSFQIGSYSPFKPKRSFTTKVRYRLSGRMTPLPLDLEE